MVLNGQLFEPSFQNVGEEVPGFYKDQIKMHKIRSVEFDIVDKQDYQVVDDRDLSRHYEFNNKGMIERSYYTLVKRIVREELHSPPIYRRRKMISRGTVTYRNTFEYDTLTSAFLYDDKGNITCKRDRDGDFYKANYFWYDSLSRISRMLTCKETNLSVDKSTFMLGVQQVLTDEHYKYQQFSKIQYKKLCLNDEDRVYKEVIIDLGGDGKPLKQSEAFVTTWIQQVTEFEYDSLGRIIEKRYKGNAGSPVDLKETYTYKDGVAESEKHYRNGTLTTETAYLYDIETKLLSSYVMRDYIRKTMQIVKMRYVFYP